MITPNANKARSNRTLVSKLTKDLAQKDAALIGCKATIRNLSDKLYTVEQQAKQLAKGKNPATNKCVSCDDLESRLRHSHRHIESLGREVQAAQNLAKHWRKLFWVLMAAALPFSIITNFF